MLVALAEKYTKYIKKTVKYLMSCLYLTKLYKTGGNKMSNIAIEKQIKLVTIML
jgi:hypothetical protein